MHLDWGMQPEDLVRVTDSHVRPFNDAFYNYFQTYDALTDVAFVSRNTPWWTPQFLRTVRMLEHDLVGTQNHAAKVPC